jgi:DNA-binding transcriptional MocR family regulator
MLPSGREIAGQLGVSLATAAKVAGGLQALGLVTLRPGAGNVVRRHGICGRRSEARLSGGLLMRPGDGPLRRVAAPDGPGREWIDDPGYQPRVRWRPAIDYTASNQLHGA